MSAASLSLTRARKQGGRLGRNQLSNYAHSVLGWLYYFPSGTFAAIQQRVPWRVRPNPVDVVALNFVAVTDLVVLDSPKLTSKITQKSFPWA